MSYSKISLLTLFRLHASSRTNLGKDNYKLCNLQTDGFYFVFHHVMVAGHFVFLQEIVCPHIDDLTQSFHMIFVIHM